MEHRGRVIKSESTFTFLTANVYSGKFLTFKTKQTENTDDQMPTNQSTYLYIKIFFKDPSVNHNYLKIKLCFFKKIVTNMTLSLKVFQNEFSFLINKKNVLVTEIM